MTVRSTRALSLLALLLFAILSAWRDIYAKTLFRDIPAISPVVVTWISAAISWLFLYAVTCAADRQPYVFQDVRSLSPTGRRDLILNNVGTVVAFLTAFWAIRLLEPYSIALVDYGASPVLTALLALRLRNERLGVNGFLGLIFCVLGIAVLVLALAGGARRETISAEYLFGLLLALVSAVAFAANQIWNKNLVERGIVRQRLLLSRLILLLIVLLPFAWADLPALAPVALEVVIWSLLGMALPLYMLMYAFERLQVKNVAYALFLIPVFIFLGSLREGFIVKDQWMYATAGALVLIGVGLGEWPAQKKTSPIVDGNPQAVES
jgi:drug/metabolite transporter (DMT)-like permease